MKKSRVKKNGSCAYCGKNGPLTRDHIPPKSLFAKPLPPDLITVGCCFECNNDPSKDDEYFRLALSIRYDVDRSQAKDAAESALRSLRRKEQQGFTRSFLSSTREVDIYTKDGQYLGTGGEYDVDLERLNLVATRIIRGLYHHHFKKIIPPQWSVDAWCIEGFPQQGKGLSAVKGIISELLSQMPIAKANGAFKYWFKPIGEPEDLSSVWYMLFFSRVGFFGMTTNSFKGSALDTRQLSLIHL
jgi:hypothetical protein